MNGFKKSLVALLLISGISGAANAVKVNIPVEGATLNVSFQLQPWFYVTENGTPNGQDPSYELYIRRSRLLINGDANKNFSYLIQFDNSNFGKRGDYSGRVIIQDAWVGFAPTGITGPNVLYIDAGILLIPFSHQALTSTTNFITAEVHQDSFRGLGGTENVPGLRDIGVQLRGWALDKKIGFRGGFYQGQRGYIAADAGKNPQAKPRMSGFVNFDILGSEEGAWLYAQNYWTKTPILSVGFAGIYQSNATKGPTGITDQGVFSADTFLDFPFGEDAEITAEATLHRSVNGRASSNTGWGYWADVGVRFGNWKPYVSFESFSADSCPTEVVAVCTGKGGSVSPTFGPTDSRLTKAGVNYFIDRNRNHVNAEFQINRGFTGAFGPASQNPDISVQGTKAFLLHWNHIF